MDEPEAFPLRRRRSRSGGLISAQRPGELFDSIIR